MSREHLLFSIALLFGIFVYTTDVHGDSRNLEDPFSPEYVLATTDTLPPLEDRSGDYITDPNNNPFDLQDPPIIEQNVEFDPETGQYIISETMGDIYFRPPIYMTFEEYLEYQQEQQENNYFRELSGIHTGERGVSGRIDPMATVDLKNQLIERLFGGTDVDIRPQGSIDLTFGVDYQKQQNPGITLRQQRQGGFDFDMQIQMNVEGSIGEKLKLSTNYNTQATFDFDNVMKLQYGTDNFGEDEIIKRIEAGNVSLPLRGTLIQGSQSLFGLLTELQFGRLRLTAVASQQKSERQTITLEGGSEFQKFEVRSDEYDENRHFFLTHYNRDNFEKTLAELPRINTLFQIKRIQVWVTDTRNAVENIREIVAISDLGEPVRVTNENPLLQPPATPVYTDLDGQALPDNFANPVYPSLIDDSNTRLSDQVVSRLSSGSISMQQARDYEKVTARLLSPTEFSYNPEWMSVSLCMS